MIQKPALFGIPDAGTAVRLAFVSVALWWLLFSIPLLRQVAEPPHRGGASERLSGTSIITGASAIETLKARRYREHLFLLASSSTTTDPDDDPEATIYGTEIASMDRHDRGGLCAFTACVRFMFGMVAAASRERAVSGGWPYPPSSPARYSMRTAHFYALAVWLAWSLSSLSAQP